MSHKYEIVLSFAGENREVASKIADKLEANGVSVFYDKYEEADLWGKDLYDHLSEVYSEQGRYCIMIISEHYAKKAWTNHERRSAQERAFKENEEYILPVRLDDTKIPGIRDTVGYLDLRKKSISDIVRATLSKLGKKPLGKSEKQDGEVESASAQPRMPDIKKEFSDKEKEEFLYDAFSFIRTYIKNGLQKIESNNSNIETSFGDIHSFKFTGKIFSEGKKVQAFKIWIGGFTSTDAICLSLGSFSIDNDNSMSEMIYIKENNGKLFLNITMGNWGVGDHRGLRNKEDTAGYLWNRIIQPLEH